MLTVNLIVSGDCQAKGILKYMYAAGVTVAAWYNHGIFETLHVIVGIRV